jgi:Tfp pilus assembly protein PilN
MMRVNLLPPEILEKRRSERRIVYVVIAAVLVAVVLAAVWVFAFVRLEGKKTDLAVKEQEVQLAQAQAAQLEIFERQATELESRRATVATALSGRVGWSKFFDELSLVFPSDLWVATLNASEDSGLTLDGYAVDSPTDVPDAGHKSIAKLLVRLADLEQLYDVWLTNSLKTTFVEQDAIQFSVTAKVSIPPAEGDPAPPSTPTP